LSDVNDFAPADVPPQEGGVAAAKSRRAVDIFSAPRTHALSPIGASAGC
jgi:hypothetical protein